MKYTIHTLRINRKWKSTRSSWTSITWEYQTCTPCRRWPRGISISFFFVYRVMLTNTMSRLNKIECPTRILLAGYELGRLSHIYGTRVPNLFAITHYYSDAYGQEPRGPYVRHGDIAPVGMPPIKMCHFTQPSLLQHLYKMKKWDTCCQMKIYKSWSIKITRNIRVTQL